MDEIEYKKMFELEEKNWWFVGKRIIITGLIKKYLKPGRNKIVDVGCGTGLLLKELQAIGDVFGVDASNYAAGFCRRRGLSNVLVGSADHLPFDNNSVDAILALDLIEHLDNVEEALFEFFNKLKSGGFVIIAVPAFQFLWSRHDEALGHKKRYSRKELVLKIMEAGFETKKISYTNFFIFPVVCFFRLLRKVFNREDENLQSDNPMVPSFFNATLINLLKIESCIINWLNLPFGISIIGVAKKP